MIWKINWDEKVLWDIKIAAVNYFNYSFVVFSTFNASSMFYVGRSLIK